MLSAIFRPDRRVSWSAYATDQAMRHIVATRDRIPIARCGAAVPFIPPPRKPTPDQSAFFELVAGGVRRANRSGTEGIPDRLLFQRNLGSILIGERKRLYEEFKTGALTLEALFERLTSLAERSLREALQFARLKLEERFGRSSSPFHILAMGKFGGRELTFSSDLDLVFLYDHDGETDGSVKAANIQFFTELVEEIIRLLRGSYDIDLGLVPERERLARVVCSWRSFADYQKDKALRSEKMTLLKGRRIRLSPDERGSFPEELSPFIWDVPYGLEFGPELHRNKLDIESRSQENAGWYDLKYGPGGIVEIEWSTQFLQLLHGGGNRKVRSPNTLAAIHTLAEEGFLSAEKASLLEEAYRYYRTLETHLRYLTRLGTNQLQKGGERGGKIEHYRQLVRSTYLEILGIK